MFRRRVPPDRQDYDDSTSERDRKHSQLVVGLRPGGEFHALSTVNLSDQGLTSLPSEVGQLTNVTLLNLSDNR